MNFIFFLGRFHVLALHLPITLLLVAILMEWLSRRDRFAALRGALPFLWSASAATAILTVALGYMHFAEGGFTGPSASAHRLLGSSTAVVTTVAWLLRRYQYAIFNKVQPVVGVLLIVLVTLTGHFGGNLTHGDTFLVKYAPGPLQRLAGVAEERPVVKDVASADPFLDIVRPIFAQRCFSCHNDDKQRGGLSLANYGAVMKGGKEGPVIVAGAADKSDLFRRITLPHEHKDFMPAEGKTPLDERQTAIVRWWIESGAKTAVTVSKLAVPADLQPILAAQLGLTGGNGAGAAPGAGPSDLAVKDADPQLVSQLEKAGFAVRQRSLSDPALIVRPETFGAAISPAQIQQLGAASTQIVELSLQRGQVDDNALAPLEKLTELTHLRLDGNKISDSGLARIGVHSRLQYLNLYGNTAITDASIQRLASLPALKELYLWGTGITPDGITRLKKLRPQLVVDSGDITNNDSSAKR